MSFQTTRQDESHYVLSIQGANNDKDKVASIVFKNYDLDSNTKFLMAGIEVENAFDGLDDGYGVMHLKTAAAGVIKNVVTITHDDRVGIGTESPGSTLDVSGNVTILGDLSVNGSIFGTGIGGGGGGDTDIVTSVNLSVGGVSTLEGTLDVSGNAIFDSDVDILNNVRIGGSLSVATLYGTVVPSGDLASENDLIVAGVSKLSGDTYIGSNLSVSGTIYSTTLDVSDNLFVGGTLSVAGTTYVSSLDVSGYLSVTGTTVTNTLDVSENALLRGSLDVSGSTVLGNILSVGGPTTFGTNVVLATDLDVVGGTRIGGVLSVSGPTIGSSLSLSSSLDVSGSTVLGNTLSVGGPTIGSSLSLSSSLDVSGSTVLGNTLSVGGPVTLSDGLNVSGDIALDGSMVMSDILSVGGAVDITGDLLVSGEITFTNTQVTLSSDGNIFRDGVSTILDRIKYIKRESDFGDVSGNKIYLKPNISYQLDGVIDVSNTLVTAAGTTFFGAGYEDGLFFNSDTSNNECCIEVTDCDFVAFFMSFQAPYTTLFKATNIIYNASIPTANLKFRFQLFSTRITNVKKLGTVDGFGTININNNLIAYCGASFEISNGRSLEFINNKVVLWMINGPYQTVNDVAGDAIMLELTSNDRDASNLGYGFQVINISGNVFHPRNFGGANIQTAIYIRDGHTSVLGLIGNNTVIVESGAVQIGFDGLSSFNKFVTYEVVGNSGVEDQKPQIEMKRVNINTLLGLTYDYVEIDSASLVNGKRLVVVSTAFDAFGNGFIEYQDAKTRPLLFWVNLEIRVTGGNPNTRFNFNAYLETESGYTGPSSQTATQADYGTLTDLSFQSTGKSSIQGNVLYASLTFSTIIRATQFTRYRILFNNENGDIGLDTDYNYHVIISSL